MLKLLVGLKPGEELANASVPIRWCVSPETTRALVDAGAKRPQVLLVAMDGYEEYRYLGPLEDMVQYIMFHRAGTHIIFGAIVWHPEGKVGKLRHHLLGKKDGDWGTTLISRDRDENNKKTYEFHPETGKDAIYSEEDHAELEIVVPKAAFAPEPSAREKKWVNWLWKSQCKDECHFRKRKIFAYTIQPLLALGYGILYVLFCTVKWLLTLICTIGLTIIALALLVNPRRVIYFGELKNLRRCNANRLTDRIYSLSDRYPEKYSGWEMASFRCHSGWVKLVGKLLDKLFQSDETTDKNRRKRLAKQAERERLAREAVEREMARILAMEYLTCEQLDEADPKKVTRTRQRIYLTFMELKGEVCKPFQRG